MPNSAVWTNSGTLARKQSFSIVKKVDTGTTITTTTLANIWTPATGKTVVLKYALLYAYVTTALSGATAGDGPALLDNAVASPLLVLGRIAAAADAVGTAYTFFASTPFKLDNGIQLAAANNVLKIGTTATIGSGVIRVIGVVAGDEV
jgi:hypothetical protein